jgi:integrase
MSNSLYDDEIYNETVKQNYLQKYKESTQKTILRIFKASSPSENDMGKDLHQFNREEIRRFLFTLRPKNVVSSRQNGNLISGYIDWAIEQGLRKSLNPLDAIPKDWYEQFVDKDEQQLFTESELNEIVDKCENAQDAVIVQLIMEGVLGEANEELLNLRKNDIDFDNGILELRDEIKNASRKLYPVSEKCLRLCRQALSETEYVKANGDASPDTKALSTKLADNEFLIKSSLTNTKNMGKADKNIIHRRLDVLSKYFNKPNLTPKNIQYSGMLIMARDKFLKEGELGRDQYNEIFERYTPEYGEDNFESIYQRVKNNFLNLETLQKLYPDIKS